MLLKLCPRVSLISMVLVLATLLAAPLASAQAQQVGTIKDKPTTKDGGRYVRGEEGWFWYNREPDPPPIEEPVKPLPTPATPPTEEPQLKPFSAEWIAKKLDETRLTAIDNPTKENMELYLLLQKFAMDKSEQFALAHQRYAMLNPAIDETVQNPVGGTSRLSMTKAQEQGMKDILAKIAGFSGIWYFYASECQFCHQQNPVMDMLENMVGMSVLPISLDGRSSPDGYLPNWRPDRGQAQMLGVQGTPTMYIVNPDTNKVLLLGSGVRTLPDLQRRIVEIAKEENWISMEDYDLAMRGLPRKFIPDGLDPGEITDESPAAILAALREASSHGQVQSTTYDAVDPSTVTPWSPTNTTRR